MKPPAIGTSGWNYDTWKSDFYEGVPKKRWLAHCADKFTALEANGTFYMLQKPTTLERWVEETPDDFRFAIKGHRYVTHYKRLLNAEETVGNCRENAQPLGDKLSAVLWQLPGNFERDDERLDGFLKALEGWSSVRHAFEPRHPTWFEDAVADRLADAGVAVCWSDAADWPMWEAVTTDLVYVRLHGHTRTYKSGYRKDNLERWADRVRTWRKEHRDVHVYFDNDGEGHAPRDALTLLDLLRG